MTTQKPISQMTAEELKSALAKLEAPAPKVDSAGAVPAGEAGETVQMPEDFTLGIATECDTPVDILDLRRGEKSKAGGDKWVIVLQVAEGEYKGEMGELHATPPIAVKTLIRAGAKMRYDRKTRQVGYNLRDIIGFKCLCRWRDSGAGFIRPDTLLPLKSEAVL